MVSDCSKMGLVPTDFQSPKHPGLPFASPTTVAFLWDLGMSDAALRDRAIVDTSAGLPMRP